MSLTRIPWQPQLFVHPDFLSKLTLASNRLGRKIFLGDDRSPNGEWLSAWRSRAGTEYLWNGWVKKLPGFSPASNPNNGPRSHQRGVGGDLQTWSNEIYTALKGAGIQVNGVSGEPWHIQLPNFMQYPIINDNTTTAGNGVTPIGDDDMQDADWARLDIGLQSVIDQIRGDKAATILQVRNDLGYMRDTTFKSLQTSINSLTVDSSGAVDVQPLLDAITALPEETAVAVKASLKAAL